MNIIKELQWRGLLKQITNETKIINAEKQHVGVYCGFDPTADSLHIGHLVLITALKRFSDYGFKAIALVGGGTGMIGDPSFKADERQLQTNAQVLKNYQAIQKQLQAIVGEIEFVNNADWLNEMKVIDYLRDVGKDFNISYLLNKESIATRISSGLSFTEFTYTILQAYDFYHLYNNNNCHVQIGGSDQWGNITSGTDYITAKLGPDKSQAAGVTLQLLLKADGTKFGKTTNGAIWLNEHKTSVYNFYQFLLNQNDSDVENLLKFLTFLDQQSIAKLKQAHLHNPKAKIMQNTLAEHVTSFVHGAGKTKQAQQLTTAFFQGNILDLKPELIDLAISSMNFVTVNPNDLVVDAILKVGAATSRREIREFISTKALSLNNNVLNNETLKIADIKPILTNKIILKKGKRNYFVLEIN